MVAVLGDLVQGQAEEVDHRMAGHLDTDRVDQGDPATRGEASRPSSAVIQPAVELPMTVTSLTSNSFNSPL